MNTGTKVTTHDIELPPPTKKLVIRFSDDPPVYYWDEAAVRAAIEADRKRHDRMLAHEWIRPALGLSEDAPYRFDFYAQEIEKLRNDSDYRKRRGEPVAWLVTGPYEKVSFADQGTAEKYRTGLNRGYGEEAYQVIPLYADPQPAEPDLAWCAECGAELIPVRPGKWQHPDCSQSPWAAEPVAFSFELASTRSGDGEYTNWSPRLSYSMPNVPAGSIRNLQWLYAAPQPKEPT